MRRITFARHRPFFLGVVAGLAGLAAGFWTGPLPATVIGANAFFLVYLGMMGIGLGQLTPDYLARHAASADEPVWVIFVATFAAVVAAVTALFLIINAGQYPHPFALGLALCAVPLGWFTIHMMAAVHYAHLFWRPGPAAKKERPGPSGGLEFPSTAKPDGHDFVYFAYVIGMTAQTSDVGVSAGSMRRAVLVHSIVSFFFNTVLVAAAVNLAVTLGSHP